jgi:hypothetical protein
MLKLCRELDEAMLQEERLKVRARLEQKRKPFFLEPCSMTFDWSLGGFCGCAADFSSVPF